MPRAVRLLATVAALLLVAGVVAVFAIGETPRDGDTDVVADPGPTPTEPAVTATPPSGTPEPAVTEPPTTPGATETPGAADEPAPGATESAPPAGDGTAPDASPEPAGMPDAASDGAGDDPSIEAMNGDVQLPSTGAGTAAAGLLALAAASGLGATGRRR